MLDVALEPKWHFDHLGNFGWVQGGLASPSALRFRPDLRSLLTRSWREIGKRTKFFGPLVLDLDGHHVAGLSRQGIAVGRIWEVDFGRPLAQASVGLVWVWQFCQVR